MWRGLAGFSSVDWRRRLIEEMAWSFFFSLVIMALLCHWTKRSRSRADQKYMYTKRDERTHKDQPTVLDAAPTLSLSLKKQSGVNLYRSHCNNNKRERGRIMTLWMRFLNTKRLRDRHLVQTALVSKVYEIQQQQQFVPIINQSNGATFTQFAQFLVW